MANEVASAIVNMFIRASPEQICCLIDKHGLLESLSHIIKSFDDQKQKILSAIFKVLKTGHKNSVKEAGLVEIIEGLANNSGALSLKAKYLLQYLSMIEKYGQDLPDMLKYYQIIFGIN